MAMNPKQLRDLKAAIKRRERRPEPAFQPPPKLELTKGQRDRITRSHVGVMLNVETTINDTWQRQPDVDDLDVEQALLAELLSSEAPAEGQAGTLAQSLKESHARWSDLDVSEEEWSLVLRAILDSVRTHSTGQKGSQRYLVFAADFLADAKMKMRTSHL